MGDTTSSSSSTANSGVTHPGSNVQETGAAAPSGPVLPVPIEFDQIQGNIFGGFLKDHQLNIFLKIKDRAQALATLRPQKIGEDVPGIYIHVKNSSSRQVLAFNEQFKALRRANMPEGSIQATWTNIVFTAKGMDALGVPRVTAFPQAFTGGNGLDGMAGRAETIGDVDANGVENGPTHWNDDMDVVIPWADVHAMILVASDDPQELDRCVRDSRVSKYMEALEASNSGIEVLGVIRGETRVDEVGHEHFGFKDGVSQPGIRGVDAPDDPLHNPNQGNPGQDLLHPGEFVLGYPRQINKADTDTDGPNPNPGPVSGKELPDWAKNGSFLVFRRLAQDVKGFREHVAKNAALLGLSSDLYGAKIVGRFRSGAPLEALKFQAGNGEYEVPLTDPGIAHPALANSDALDNDFEYGEDPDGDIVPLSAHIRKAYPRDQVPLWEKNQVNPLQGHEKDAESRTQTHRLLRRGIPFGKSLGAPEGGGPNDPRGLLFFAYQWDLETQFEFVQKFWVNDPEFPRMAGQPAGALLPAGQDPIITNDSAAGPIRGCPFHALASKAACPSLTSRHFVKTRGGGYFFSPSIDTLGKWLKFPAKASEQSTA